MNNIHSLEVVNRVSMVSETQLQVGENLALNKSLFRRATYGRNSENCN